MLRRPRKRKPRQEPDREQPEQQPRVERTATTAPSRAAARTAAATSAAGARGDGEIGRNAANADLRGGRGTRKSRRTQPHAQGLAIGDAAAAQPDIVAADRDLAI